MIQKIKNKNGNIISIECQDFDKLSVLEPGYAILPDGHCIPVKDDQDHSSVFCDLLMKYLEEDYQFSETPEAVIRLNEAGCVAYIGTRFFDGRETENGFGIFSFPEDVSTITEEQKLAVHKIAKTNHSQISKREILSLQYGTVAKIEYTQEEVEEILKPHHKTK